MSATPPTEFVPLRIDPDPNSGMPGINANFGRITVILGANGSGKSKLLRTIRDKHRSAFGPERTVTFVEGGRVVPIPAQLKLSPKNVAVYSNYASALRSHRKKRNQKLADRISDALFTLERRNEENKVAHSDAVDAWNQGGRVAAYPEREEPPLDRLFRLYADVFPNLSLTLDESRHLRAKRTGNPYSASDLSDGERQALAILADIRMLADANSLILVDEPELNLHPFLASTLWEAIEHDLPQAVFVYATHSISFAMRPSVNCVVALSSTGESVTVDDPSSLDSTELRPFLGSIPAILNAEKVVVVEGDETSFDREFYCWVCRGVVEPLAVLPLGSSNDVAAAATRTGVWERLAPSVRLAGLVDRDYRSEKQIEWLEEHRCIVLKYHEAESYLCVPELLATLAAKLGISEPLPSERDFLEIIHQSAVSLEVKVAAQRTFSRATHTVNIALPRKALIAAINDDQLLDLLKKECEAESVKAQEIIGGSAVESAFHEERQRVSDALKSRDIEGLLTVFPAKELLHAILRRLELRNSRQLILAAKRHLEPSAFPQVKELRDRIANTFCSTAS